MSNYLTNGVSITVSTDALESKIDAATGKFIKTLSKSQRTLGLSFDETGILSMQINNLSKYCR